MSPSATVVTSDARGEPTSTRRAASGRAGCQCPGAGKARWPCPGRPSSLNRGLSEHALVARIQVRGPTPESRRPFGPEPPPRAIDLETAESGLGSLRSATERGGGFIKAAQSDRAVPCQSTREWRGTLFIPLFKGLKLGPEPALGHLSWLYDCSMVMQITLNTELEPHGLDPCQGQSYEKVAEQALDT
jgi:hypothetical protein